MRPTHIGACTCVACLLWSLLLLPLAAGVTVNFVYSKATLLSGGLADCPTPLSETCVGGVATVAAYVRNHTDSTGEHATFLPYCDRQTPFVQMHPFGWSVNRLILQDHFGWSAFVAPLSLLTSSRDLSQLRNHDMPLLITNAMVPPSSPWYPFTEIVHFDEKTRLAIMYHDSSTQANSWPMIDSALNALDYVAWTNAGLAAVEGGDSFWIPVVVSSDPAAFAPLLTAVVAHENPPGLLLDASGKAAGYDPPRIVNQTWVGSFKESGKRSHRFRIVLGADNRNVTNVTLSVDDLRALPPAMKDASYEADQIYLKSLADEAVINDPIVGDSGEMPLTRQGDIRMCMAGECPIGNLFTDAIRWKSGADVAFQTSGGLRGPGWPAGPVRMSNLWAALPFANTLCTGSMSGAAMFKLLNFSTAVATYESTYTLMGDRLVQVSGLQYTYNTKLNHSRLISVDVWDNATRQYLPLERARLYSFVTDSFMCGVFDPFPDFFGGSAAIDDNLVQNVVGEYLSQLEEPYNTTTQGRLRNDTTSFSPMRDHTRDNCPANTFWNEQILTCSECPEATSHVAFSEERVELEGRSGDDVHARVVLSNREIFDVTIDMKESPTWVEFSEGLTDLLRGNSTIVTLRAGESIAIIVTTRTAEFEAAGTAQGRVSFTALDKSRHPDCPYDGDVAFDVFVRIIPPTQLNHLSRGMRSVGLVLMSVTVVSSFYFAAWVWYHRKVRIVRASQPVFLQLICVGTVIMGAAIIPLTVDDGIASVRGCNIACMATPWLISVGFTITFSALFSKIWRINKLFHNSRNFKKIKVSQKDVMVPFALLFTFNFALLLAWTLVDPLVWTRTPVDGGGDSTTGYWNTYGHCEAGGNASVTFAVLVLLLNVGALLLACAQAYRARNVDDEYSESKYIGIAMCSWLQVCSVGIPVLFLVDGKPAASYFLKAMLVFIVSMSTLLLIFVPKLILWRGVKKRRSRVKRASKERPRLACPSMAAEIGSSMVATSSEGNLEESSGLQGMRAILLVRKTEQDFENEREMKLQLEKSQERVSELEQMLHKKEEKPILDLEEDGQLTSFSTHVRNAESSSCPDLVAPSTCSDGDAGLQEDDQLMATLTQGNSVGSLVTGLESSTTCSW